MDVVLSGAAGVGEARARLPAPSGVQPAACAAEAHALGHAGRARGVQKKLRRTVAAARRQARGRRVEVWAFDEHRLGLKPLRRRVWAKCGRRPLAVSHHKYRWLYLYGFVHPASGAVEWWLASTVGVALFQAVLDAFAQSAGAGADKIIVLLLDNAGWHVSGKLSVPDGIRLCFLPPYTPELQPAERLWPLTDEAVANKPFETIDDLAETLDRRCSALADDPDVVRSNTRFNWWPAE